MAATEVVHSSIPRSFKQLTNMNEEPFTLECSISRGRVYIVSRFEINKNHSAFEIGQSWFCNAVNGERKRNFVLARVQFARSNWLAEIFCVDWNSKISNRLQLISSPFYFLLRMRWYPSLLLAQYGHVGVGPRCDSSSTFKPF